MCREDVVPPSLVDVWAGAASLDRGWSQLLSAFRTLRSSSKRRQRTFSAMALQQNGGQRNGGLRRRYNRCMGIFQQIRALVAAGDYVPAARLVTVYFYD